MKDGCSVKKLGHSVTKVRPRCLVRIRRPSDGKAAVPTELNEGVVGGKGDRNDTFTIAAGGKGGAGAESSPCK